MPSLIELIDKSSIIKSKVRDIYSSINKDLLSGIIKDRTEMFMKFHDEVTKFLSSFVYPEFRYREMHKIPISSDINDMIQELYNDLSRLYNSTAENSSILDTAFERVLVEKDMLLSMSNVINKKINDIENDISVMFAGDETRQSFIEEFANHDSFDTDMCTTPCSIDLLSGVLVLPKMSILDHLNPDIVIDNVSNGFPGDTHRAYISSGKIIYSGEQDPHIDMTALVDNINDTWFEYESVSVDDEVYNKLKGYGFEYKEGITWITSDNKLVLKLILSYSIARHMNWISINPFIPVESSYIPSTISSIVVDDGKGSYTNIIESPFIFNKESVFTFESQNVKYIYITIEQPNSYSIQIGHKYYTDIDINVPILEKVSTDNERVNGDNPSVELIGIKYDSTTGTISNPILNSDYIQPQFLRLFNSDTGSLELIDGTRYQIGIRGISCSSIEFDQYGEYISRQYKFDLPINSLYLEASDYIPSQFSADSIKYFISIDNGRSWTQVNKDTTVQLLNDVSYVRIKVLLSRPTINNYSKYNTPIIYSYKLSGRNV